MVLKPSTRCQAAIGSLTENSMSSSEVYIDAAKLLIEPISRITFLSSAKSTVPPRTVNSPSWQVNSHETEFLSIILNGTRLCYLNLEVLHSSTLSPKPNRAPDFGDNHVGTLITLGHGVCHEVTPLMTGMKGYMEKKFSFVCHPIGQGQMTSPKTCTDGETELSRLTAGQHYRPTCTDCPSVFGALWRTTTIAGLLRDL